LNVVDLDQAVARLAADISDHEVDEEQQRRKKDAATLSFSRLHWVKREMAIKRLYVAFCNGSLIAVVRDPVSGALSLRAGHLWRHRRSDQASGGTGALQSFAQQSAA